MKKTLAILLLAVLFVGSELQAQDTAKPALRIWKDSTGQFSIQATFVRVNGELVVLQGIDKKEISLPLAKLSETDQQYVKARLAPKQPAAATLPQALQVLSWLRPSILTTAERRFQTSTGAIRFYEGELQRYKNEGTAQQKTAAQQITSGVALARKKDLQSVKPDWQIEVIRWLPRLIPKQEADAIIRRGIMKNGAPDPNTYVEIQGARERREALIELSIMLGFGTLEEKETGVILMNCVALGQTRGLDSVRPDFQQFVADFLPRIMGDLGAAPILARWTPPPREEVNTYNERQLRLVKARSYPGVKKLIELTTIGTAEERAATAKLLAAVEIAVADGIRHAPSSEQRELLDKLPRLIGQEEATALIYKGITDAGGFLPDKIVDTGVPTRKAAFMELQKLIYFGTGAQREYGRKLSNALAAAESMGFTFVAAELRRDVRLWLPLLHGKEKANSIISP